MLFIYALINEKILQRKDGIVNSELEKCTFGRGEGVCCFVKGEKEKKATDAISAIELQEIDRKKLRMEHKRQQLGLP